MTTEKIKKGEVSPSLQPPVAFFATLSAGATPATPPNCHTDSELLTQFHKMDGEK